MVEGNFRKKLGVTVGFKTQAEIYKALLDGTRIRKKDQPNYFFVYLVDGMLVSHQGKPVSWSFDCPDQWIIKEDTPTHAFKESFFESFYDSRSGEFYDFQVGSKSHEFALQNKNLTRAPSKDFIKRIPLEVQEY